MTNNSGTAAQAQVNTNKKRFRRIMLVLAVSSVLLFVVSIAVGRAGITNPLKLAQAIWRNSQDYKQMLRILQNIRIPRSLAAFMVGACLSVAGLVYQTTFNNK